MAAAGYRSARERPSRQRTTSTGSLRVPSRRRSAFRYTLTGGLEVTPLEPFFFFFLRAAVSRYPTNALPAPAPAFLAPEPGRVNAANSPSYWPSAANRLASSANDTAPESRFVVSPPTSWARNEPMSPLDGVALGPEITRS